MEYIARAVIEENGKILLCHGKGRPNWYFPGGHIERGESAVGALVRELYEELGVTAIVERFLGASENMFTLSGEKIQEINLVFQVSLDASMATESGEDHIEFAWFTREEIKDLLVFPVSLRDAVITRTTKTKELLWASEGFEN